MIPSRVIKTIAQLFKTDIRYLLHRYIQINQINLLPYILTPIAVSNSLLCHFIWTAFHSVSWALMSFCCRRFCCCWCCCCYCVWLTLHICRCEEAAGIRLRSRVRFRKAWNCLNRWLLLENGHSRGACCWSPEECVVSGSTVKCNYASRAHGRWCWSG